ncbi:MAG: hypothetical protein LBT38_07480 [Deltaproteobacteria bacterium]|nr:hypothetical protein [Deltaproteobacteria bacterium]
MAENRELRRELALKLEEIESLKISCAGLKPERTNSGPLEPDQKPGPVIFAARVGENKYFFNDRLILTVVDINNLDREAAIRLHFVDTARRETSLVKVGEPLTINFEGQESQVFLDQLKGSVAYFSFYENQSRPEKPKATEEPIKSENSEESAAS